MPDHLLVNYRKSLVAICLAQFNSTKGFEGGGKVQAFTFFCRVCWSTISNSFYDGLSALSIAFQARHVALMCGAGVQVDMVARL